MALPTPYDSWCGGYDIVNGKDARSNFNTMTLTPTATDTFGLLINADAGFVGNFVQMQIAGVDIAYIDFNGNYIGTATNLIFSAAGYIALIPTTYIFLGDGGVTNYVRIDNAGFLSFVGAAAVDDDLPFETSVNTRSITTTGGQDFRIYPLQAGGGAPASYWFYDASTDRWGYGTNAPTSPLDIVLSTNIRANSASTFAAGSLAVTYFIVDGNTPAIKVLSSCDLIVYSDAGATEQVRIDGATGDIVPGAIGGANLGTTALEWGNVYIGDNFAVYFGNDQDALVFYDEAASDDLVWDMGAADWKWYDGPTVTCYAGAGVTPTFILKGDGGGAELMGVGGASAGLVDLNLRGHHFVQRYTVDLDVAADIPYGSLVDADAAVDDRVATSAINSTAVVGVITLNPHGGGVAGAVCTVQGSVVEILLTAAGVRGQYVATGGVGGQGTAQAALPAAGRTVGICVQTTGGGGLCRCIFLRM